MCWATAWRARWWRDGKGSIWFRRRRYDRVHVLSLAGPARSPDLRRRGAELALVSRTRRFRRGRPPEPPRYLGRSAWHAYQVVDGYTRPGALQSHRVG